MKKPLIHHALTSLLFLLTMLLATACNDGGKYEIRESKVYYTYWTWSFGPQNYELEDADSASFESIEDWVARDDQHVWFKQRLIKGADPASIEVEDYPLLHDKHDYYYKGAALGVKDMATFRIEKCNDDELWATDSRYIYFDSLRIEGSDPATFEYLEFVEAKDRLHVYYFGHILEEADPATYEVMGNYARDKQHVFYCGHIVEGADPATLVVEQKFEMDKPDAKDKNNYYRNGKVFNYNK